MGMLQRNPMLTVYVCVLKMLIFVVFDPVYYVQFMVDTKESKNPVWM